MHCPEPYVTSVYFRTTHQITVNPNYSMSMSHDFGHVIFIFNYCKK